MLHVELELSLCIALMSWMCSISDPSRFTADNGVRAFVLQEGGPIVLPVNVKANFV